MTMFQASWALLQLVAHDHAGLDPFAVFADEDALHFLLGNLNLVAGESFQSQHGPDNVLFVLHRAQLRSL